MDLNSFVYSEFDSRHLDKSCFRLAEVTPQMEDELSFLRKTHRKLFIDAKIDASEVLLQRRLLAGGFYKVCCQVLLVKQLEEDLSHLKLSPSIQPCLDLSEDELRRHALNFRYDRFHQDAKLSAGSCDSLFMEWISNSTSGRKLVCCVGADFCTFSESDMQISIDLVSVLESGRGIGSALLQKLFQYATSSGCREISVTTEAENARALKLYRSNGFKIRDFVSVFHFCTR